MVTKKGAVKWRQRLTEAETLRIRYLDREITTLAARLSELRAKRKAVMQRALMRRKTPSIKRSPN
ncbi:MAG: hypothetical protein KGL39_07510 [Patescibacteria group bacterium]|nr:hypothetical protein [Patescibacteria group bacterium]